MFTPFTPMLIMLICGVWVIWFLLCSIYVEYLWEINPTAFEAEIGQDISSYFATWFKQCVGVYVHFIIYLPVIQIFYLDGHV